MSKQERVRFGGCMTEKNHAYNPTEYIHAFIADEKGFPKNDKTLCGRNAGAMYSLGVIDGIPENNPSCITCEIIFCKMLGRTPTQTPRKRKPLLDTIGVWS